MHHLVPNATSALRSTLRSVRFYTGVNSLLVIKPSSPTTANDTSQSSNCRPNSPQSSPELPPDVPPGLFSAQLQRRQEQARETHSEEKRTVVSTSEDASTRYKSNRGLILQTLQEAVFSDVPQKKKKKRLKVKQSAPSAPLHKSNSASKTSDGSLSDAKLEGTEVGWKSEDWGEDKLAPSFQTGQVNSSSKTRVAPPHIRHPLPYTRRVEGLLVPSERPVLIDLQPPSKQQPIATLSHGLDRVLFNPGVHWLQDPRSRVYNFTPWLENLPSVKDFDFEKLSGFIKSSRDEDLWELAKREKRTFGGSTSSLTGILSHIYFLISSDRDVDTSTLSRHFQHEPASFTQGQRMPTSVVLNYKDGVYAIDSDSNGLDGNKNVLTWMGTMLEKFLTLPQEKFAQLMRSHPPSTKEGVDERREAYRYAKSATFVMRSQLDCQDSRLPGTGVFDIKTRAALPIRLDLLNFEENSGYLIRSLHGPLESFEKEYYDLIRSAFLKYSFQARIGGMDGVFIAYHNTARMFGFQYVPLDEMEERLFGGKGRGERVFEKCVGVLESVADEIIRIFPEQSLKCTFETLEKTKEMCVWVEPAEWSVTGTKPIAQLDVTSTSYLDKAEVRGTRAVSATEASWTLHWTVSRSSLSEDNIRYGLAAAKERLFRAYNLPTGMGFDGMAEYWETLNFGGKEADEAQPYSPKTFRKPGHNINMLRALARAGTKETTRLARENVGKQKVVWSGPDDLDSEDMDGAISYPTRDEVSAKDWISSSNEYSSLVATGGDVPDLQIDNPPIVNGSTGESDGQPLLEVRVPHGGERSADLDLKERMSPLGPTLPLVDEAVDPPRSESGAASPGGMDDKSIISPSHSAVIPPSNGSGEADSSTWEKEVRLVDVGAPPAESLENASFPNEQPSPQASESGSLSEVTVVSSQTNDESDERQEEATQSIESFSSPTRYKSAVMVKPVDVDVAEKVSPPTTPSSPSGPTCKAVGKHGSIVGNRRRRSSDLSGLISSEYH